MGTFLTGEKLSEAIRSLLAEPGVRCAVAFWGAGCEKWVTGTGAKVICNLKSGGTNPFALRKVTATLKRRDDLHAKVYIGRATAIVASANVSVNGLGLEGIEQAGWIEAGMRTDDIAALSTWFEDLWEASYDIEKADWTAAEKAWNARQKPTVRFGDFDPSMAVLPALNWIGDGEWTTCHDSIERHFKGSSEDLVRQVEDGLELEHADDEAFLRNRWVLCWSPGKSRLPRLTAPPWWVRTGSTVLKEGFRYNGEKKRRDVIMGAETMPPIPFDPTEKRFISALKIVLSRPEYVSLIAEVYTVPWFKPRDALTRELWRDVKESYLLMGTL